MQSQDRSLSVIVPSYNEEANLTDSIGEILTACEQLKDQFEILVVNDCSTDNTLQVANELAAKYPQVKVINNEKNLGFGGAYRQGIMNAEMKYSVMVCGDNCIGHESLTEIFDSIGKADMVLPYFANPEIRTTSRRFISKCYSNTINYLCGYRIKYYNGHNVFPTKPLQDIEFSDGFAYAAQIVVRLLNQGYTYSEAPMVAKPRENGDSKALQVRNVISVVKSVLGLALESHFKSLKTKATTH